MRGSHGPLPPIYVLQTALLVLFNITMGAVATCMARVVTTSETAWQMGYSRAAKKKQREAGSSNEGQVTSVLQCPPAVTTCAACQYHM